MMKLLEKNKAFEWTTECQASFEELRKCLTSAPVLVLPDQPRSLTYTVTLHVKDCDVY
jgi:hypothetical protein